MNFKRLLEDIYYLYFDNQLLEMANLQPKETGLKPIVFISSKGGAKHGPRVKVSNIVGKFDHKDHFTITVEHEPRVIGNSKLNSQHLDDVKDWVKLNHDHLHKVWHDDGQMSMRDVSKGFKKL